MAEIQAGAASKMKVYPDMLMKTKVTVKCNGYANPTAPGSRDKSK
jgi:hypothetical protein